jgi:acyl-homoserine lactone acylase PvdQ
MVPHALLPHVQNPQQGYLYSGNHRPIGSFYKIPLTNISGSWGHTVRSWRLAERLGAKERFAPEEVLDIHFDAVNPARRELVRFGYYMRDERGYRFSAGADSTLDYLEAWYAAGAPQDLRVVGAEVALHISTFFRAANTELAMRFGGGETGLIAFLSALGARIDAGGEEFSTPELDYVNRALDEAWATAERNYEQDRSVWPQKAREAVGAQRLGYFAGLHGFPSLDPSRDLGLPALETVDGATIRSQRAQAYTQYVPLDDVDRAQSILPVGNSEDPRSPFHLATWELWGEGKLHPAPLSREAVAPFVVDTVVLDMDWETVEK